VTAINEGTYLIVLVYRSHPLLALGLSYDFTSIFNDNLVGLECAIAADAVSAVGCLDDFHANIVFSPGLCPLLKLLKASVATVRAQSTVSIVTFVEHVPILTVLVASCLFCAHAFGQFHVLVGSPYTTRLSNKNI
jgi:hypothetical protein